jgi:hypothetical protein
MKKTQFLAMCAMSLVAVSLVSSCDDDTVDTLTKNIVNNTPATPAEPDEPQVDPQEVITLQDANLKGEASVTEGNLEVDGYETSADWVTYLDGVENQRYSVRQSLSLNVNFSKPADVYVKSEESLSNVSLAQSTQGAVVSDTIAGTTTGRVVTTRSSYNYKLDQDERISAQALVQKFCFGDTVLPKFEIRSIAYLKSTSERDEAISNSDSLVNNLTHVFRVSLVRDEAIRSRATELTVEDYDVEVTSRRIYKQEATPAVDTFLEEVVTGSGEDLDNGTHNYWVTIAEVWSISGQKDPVKYTYYTKYGVTAPAAKTVYTTNVSYSTTGNGLSNEKTSSSVSGLWTVTSRTQNFTTTASNGVDPFSNVYTVNDAKVVFTSAKGSKVEFPYGTWTVAEKNATIGNATESNGYYVYPYTDNIDWVYAIANDTDKGAASAKASLYVKKEEPKDELVDTNVDSNVDIVNGNEVVTVTTTETWSLSGNKVTTETVKVPISLTAPAAQTIYSVNASYATSSNGLKNGNATSRVDGNFTIYTMSRTYSSTATNGSNPFNNVYTISDSKVVYKNGSTTLTFDYGSWNIVEKSSTIGSATTSGDYEVYPYVNNISYTYTNAGKTLNGTASSSASIYVEVEKVIDKIIPEAWGTITGAGISAVPSDDESGNFAKKCLTIRTTKGAVAVVFNWNNTIATTSQVLNGNFVSGSFDSSYNSGYYTTSANKGSYSQGIWAPAIAKDGNSSILYYNGNTKVRAINFSTLDMWGWQNGHSTVVSGYSFTVDDNGVLTITKDGKEVLKIR